MNELEEKNKYLYIDLIENEQNINNNDLINTITELKEINHFY